MARQHDARRVSNVEELLRISAAEGAITNRDGYVHPLRSTRPARSEEMKVAGFCFEPEKALEALLYVAQRTPGNDMYKALKALYVADKLHLGRYGRFIYGETYCALPHGPVPQFAYDAVRAVQDGRPTPVPSELLHAALERFGASRLIPRREPDLSELSKSDVECLDEAIRDLAFDGFNTVKAKTHDAAWSATPRAGDMTIESIIEALPEDRRGPVREYLEH